MPPLIDVAIVGGGPGGLSAARSILACRPSLRIKVFERAALQARGATLYISRDGQQALEAISPDLLDRVRSCHFDNFTFTTYTDKGELMEQRTAKEIFAAMNNGVPLQVAWSDLQSQPAEELPPGVLETQSSFEGYTETEEGVEVRLAGREPVAARVLIGCDGNRSAVREACLADGPPSYMGAAIWRGRAQLPDWFEAPEGRVMFAERGGAHTLTARGMRKEQLLWTATAPWPEERLGELASAAYIQDTQVKAERAEQIKQRLLKAFEGWPEAAVRILEVTPASTMMEHGQFYRKPEQIRVWGRGRVTLLGDAAHLATSALGSGTNQALIDALELGRAMGELGPTAEALRKYEAVRIPQVTPVHAKSVGIYRDFVAGKDVKDAERNAVGAYLRQLKPVQPLACAEPAGAPTAALHVSHWHARDPGLHTAG